MINLKNKVNAYALILLALFSISQQIYAINLDSFKQIIGENNLATTALVGFGLGVGGYLVTNYLKKEGKNWFSPVKQAEQKETTHVVEKKPAIRLTDFDYKTLGDFTWKNGEKIISTFKSTIDTFQKQLNLDELISFSLQNNDFRYDVLVDSLLFKNKKRNNKTLAEFHNKYVDSQFLTDGIHSLNMSTPEAIKYK